MADETQEVGRLLPTVVAAVAEAVCVLGSGRKKTQLACAEETEGAGRRIAMHVVAVATTVC